MPIYVFQNESTGEIKEVIQSMNETHEYSENGVQWQRLFTVPNAASNTKLDPFSANQFIDKTGKQKGGKYRDLIEQSNELSERRKSIMGGEDPIKRKHFDKYQKATGKKHMSDRPTVIETNEVKIDLTPDKRGKVR